MSAFAFVCVNSLLFIFIFFIIIFLVIVSTAHSPHTFISLTGTMNGLIMVSGSLGNALGPIIGSILYAAALRAAYPHPDAPHHRNMLPIDGRIVFFLTGGMALLLAWVAKHHLVDPCSRR